MEITGILEVKKFFSLACLDMRQENEMQKRFLFTQHGIFFFLAYTRKFSLE